MFYSPFSPSPQIIRVNGENGARALQMQPNSSLLMLDENEPILWVGTTDISGFKTITGYKIEPLKPQADELGAINERLAKLEEMINAKSNTAAPKSSK